MQIKSSIPHIYLDLSKANKDRGALFRAYVKGYFARSYPGWEVVRLEGMTAVLERRAS